LSAILAVALISIATPARAEVTRLQWGGQQSTSKKQSANSNTELRFVKPGVAGSSATEASKPSGGVIKLKSVGESNKHAEATAAKTADMKKQSDNKIQLTAYEEDAPRLTSGRETEVGTRSVVVNSGQDSSDGFRSAQAPVGQGPAGGNRVEDSLRSPFADNPEEPPQPNPIPMPENGTAPVATPDDGSNATQPDDRLLQFNQNPGATGLPPGAQPETGQFQPILPPGPAPDQSPPTPPNANDGMIRAEGERAKESCDKSLENLRAYTVDKVKLDISIVGTEGEDFPFECSIDNGTMHAGRCWDQTTYMWKASALCHKPLYFEEEQLERYGHSFSPCFQPFVSGAHFFVTLPVLPYCMGVEPPCECIYALGHYRPGSCAPYMCNPVPLSLRGALFEAGAVTGTAAILP
jgi:hypothetical protein